MGEKLLKYYKYIADEVGLEGRMQLAKKTKIASIIAGTMPDSDENIKLFREAIKEITGKDAPEF